MRKLIFTLLVTVVCSGLTSCGPKVNAIPHSQAPVITPDASSAVVYVIRESRFVGGGGSLIIFEDGKPIGVVENGTYFIHKTTPGKHNYQSDSGFSRLWGVDIEALPGETYYILFDVTFQGPTLIKTSESVGKTILPKLQYATPAQ